MGWTLFIIGTLLASLWGGLSVLAAWLGSALEQGRTAPHYTGLWETCIVTTLAAAGLLTIWLTQRRRDPLVAVRVLTLIASGVAAIWWAFALTVAT